jgi:hypothetical protein
LAVRILRDVGLLRLHSKLGSGSRGIPEALQNLDCRFLHKCFLSETSDPSGPVVEIAFYDDETGDYYYHCGGGCNVWFGPFKLPEE